MYGSGSGGLNLQGSFTTRKKSHEDVGPIEDHGIIGRWSIVDGAIILPRQDCAICRNSSSCPSLPKTFQVCCLPRDAQVDFVTSDVSGVSDVEQKREAGMEGPLIFKVRTFG